MRPPAAATQQVDAGTVQLRRPGPPEPGRRPARRPGDAGRAPASPGSVTVTGGQVHVDASVTRPTVFLGLLGLTRVTGHGSATADLTVN